MKCIEKNNPIILTWICFPFSQRFWFLFIDTLLAGAGTGTTRPLLGATLCSKTSRSLPIPAFGAIGMRSLKRIPISHRSEICHRISPIPAHCAAPLPCWCFLTQFRSFQFRSFLPCVTAHCIVSRGIGFLWDVARHPIIEGLSS